MFAQLTKVILLTLIATTHLANTVEIPKRHLIVSSVRQPLVNDPELATVSVGIVEFMVLDTLSKHLNFTYEVRPPTDMLSSGYLLRNGTWTGISGQLQREEVDLCVTTMAPTVSKQSIMSFSQPVIFVDAAIIIPFPKENVKLWLENSIFLPLTWVVYGVCFVITICAAYLINRITTPDKLKLLTQNSLGFWIIYYISVWSSQGITVRNSSTPLRIVCAVSFLGIYIISNYFTANYTSFLSIPMFKTSVNSVEDLANSAEIKTLIIKGSSTEDYIMTGSKNDLVFQKIVQQMRKYPERRISNAFTVDDVSTIVKDDSALIIIKSNGESLVEKSYQLNDNKCRVTLAEKYFFSRPQSFTYPKKSPIAATIDKHILLMQQSGLIQYAERRAAASINRCSISEIKKASAAKANPLGIHDLIGAFLLLGFGIGLGIFVMILELVTSALLRKN